MIRRLASILIGIIVAGALAPALAAPASAAALFSFAVIGDMPYGATQLSLFPQRIAEINADPAVQLVGHLGDIGGPPNCSDSYYSTIKSHFDRFADPLLYTPGDNEWADCSTASIGAANPLDRLAAVRRVFFPQPGTSLGQNPMAVTAQPNYPENVQFQQQGITFGVAHIVGSENGLSLWKNNTSTTPEQKAEVNARTAADIDLIRSTFAAAKANNSRAVALLTQADMFNGSPSKAAYGELAKILAAEASAYGKPVFFFNGDTHTYTNDKPLASSTWLSYYGIATAVPNLTRIRVQGGSSVAEWLKITVVDTPEVMQVQRVPFGKAAAPVASFTSATSGLSASFDASSSTGSGGVARYAWNFGDGSTGSGAAPTHAYAAAGTYSVTLTVTDSQGATASKTNSVTVTAAAPGTGNDVVAAKSAWKWRYTSAAPPSAWKNNGYDASSWNTGNAELGYGSTPLGTNIDISGSASTRPLAAYFLKSFTLSAASAVTKFSLKAIADDGVVVYVNGTEVGRSNMPAGPVTINTYAATTQNSTTARANPVLFDVPVSLLRDGTNTIAAETHLNYRATANVTFDLTATATLSGGAPAPNQVPVAAFSSTADGLNIAFDGSGSADPDGTIGSYAWTFGDGAMGTGVTANHTYAAAGSYAVTLTVTDNKGAKGTFTHTVTVGGTVPPESGVLANDTFSRTVASGLGSAETGGTWSVTGTASRYAANGSVATITSTAKTNNFAYLTGVSSSNTNLQATIGLTRPTSSTVYAGLIGRRVGSATYGARAVVSSIGTVQLHLQLNTDTLLKTTTVQGLNLVNGDKLELRVQVTGTSPTTISAKIWKSGTAEPAAWQASATDSTGALQAAGSIGIYSYLSSTAAPNPLPVTFDNFRAIRTQ